MSSSSEFQNIPIAISLLHEQEYHNLCILLKKSKVMGKRRAFSEKMKEKNTVYHPSSFSLKG